MPLVSCYKFSFLVILKKKFGVNVILFDLNVMSLLCNSVVFHGRSKLLVKRVFLSNTFAIFLLVPRNGNPESLCDQQLCG